MKRFSFNEDDENEDDELDEMKYMPELIMSQFGDMSGDSLDIALKICEKSLFWRFYSVKKKLKILKMAFDDLNKIIEGIDDASI